MSLILPFHPETASATIVIDGVTYRVPLVDSDGHLQVDVLTTPLPTDAATATDQATMITALQLIDDLRAALDAVRTDRLNVNVYRDGASEVKGVTLLTVDPSTTRVTAITPTTGKKIRIVAVIVSSLSAQDSNMEVYFHTGANAFTNPGKIVFWGGLDVDIQISHSLAWPDGGGPVGAVDEVLSVRTGSNITSAGIFVIHYREE